MAKPSGQIAPKTIVSHKKYGYGIVVAHEIYQPLMHLVKFASLVSTEPFGLDCLTVVNTNYVNVPTLKPWFDDLLLDFIATQKLVVAAFKDQHTKEHASMTFDLQQKFIRLNDEASKTIKPSGNLIDIEKNFLFNSQYSVKGLTFKVTKSYDGIKKVYVDNVELLGEDLYVINSLVNNKIAGKAIAPTTLMIGNVIGDTYVLKNMMDYYNSI